MKIAFATEDGSTISAHLGRAPYYQIFTIQDGQFVGTELIAKAHHGSQEPHDHNHEEGHMHTRMFAPLLGVDVLIAGGMGQPAFDAAQAMGIKPLLTGEKDIQKALQAYLAGNLATDNRRIHQHGAAHDAHGI